MLKGATKQEEFRDTKSSRIHVCQSSGPSLPWPRVSLCRLPEGLAFCCVFGELFPGCVSCILQQLVPFPCCADLSPICPAPE